MEGICPPSGTVHWTTNNQQSLLKVPLQMSPRKRTRQERKLKPKSFHNKLEKLRSQNTKRSTVTKEKRMSKVSSNLLRTSQQEKTVHPPSSSERISSGQTVIANPGSQLRRRLESSMNPMPRAAR